MLTGQLQLMAFDNIFGKYANRDRRTVTGDQSEVGLSVFFKAAGDAGGEKTLRGGDAAFDDLQLTSLHSFP